MPKNKSKVSLKVFKGGECIITVFDEEEIFTHDLALRAEETKELKKLLNKKIK